MAVNALNGIAITTSSVINGISGLGAILGQSISGGGGGTPVVESASVATGTAAGASGTDPSGAASGDFLIAIVRTAGGASALTRPAGWTSLFNGTSADGDFDYDICWITRGGSAPDLAWTWTGSVAYAIHIVRISGVNATPVDAISALSSVASGAPNPPSITVGDANALVLVLMIDFFDSGSQFSVPATYTRATDNAVEFSANIAVLARGVGSEDPGVWGGGTGFANNSVTATMSIKP